MEKESGGHPSPHGAARGLQYDCILLSGAANPLPQRLIDGLRARGASVRVAGDVPSVMVELALGATPRELPRVVIVNEPGSIRRVQALLAAVRRYYPGARCWRYEAALPARTGLRPFDEPAAAVTETAASAASTGPAVPSAATPEPHGQRAVAPPPRVKPPASALDAPLVSAEELAMLLGYAESEEQAEADAKARPKGDQGNPPRRASRND